MIRMTITKLIEFLQERAVYNPDQVIAWDLWQAEDVLSLYEATDEEAEEVIAEMNRRKDATMGLTWSVLEVIADSHGLTRKPMVGG
jgi:hypothetical protein